MSILRHVLASLGKDVTNLLGYLVTELVAKAQVVAGGTSIDVGNTVQFAVRYH